MITDPLPDVPFPARDITPIERIIYISLPEDAERSIEDFEIDSSIPLPVEPPPGIDATQLQNLSWEMIVSAMLKLFAYQPEHPHLDYFRDFVQAVQPDIIEKMTQMGIVKAQNHEFDIAEEVFRTLVNFTPEEENTFINLALVFEEHAAELKDRGDDEQAEEREQFAFQAYTRGFRFHSNSSQLHYNAGHFFLQRNNLNKSREHFIKYLELEPDDSEKRQQIAALVKELDSKAQDDNLFSEAYDYIRMGQVDEGLERIKGFIKRNSEVWNAWFLLGWGLRKKGLYEEAREAFLKSIELNGSNPDAYNELAICNLELEQFQQAKNHLEKALKMEPENTKVMSNLGILAMKQGDFDLARRFFLTVMELDPNDHIAPVYLDKIEEQA